MSNRNRRSRKRRSRKFFQCDQPRNGSRSWNRKCKNRRCRNRRIKDRLI